MSFGSGLVARARCLVRSRARRGSSVPLGGRPRSLRLRAGGLLAIGLAFCVLAGQSPANGAVGDWSLVKALSAHPASEQADNTSAVHPLEAGQFATSRGNDSRDGWYPNQPGLSPQVVGSSDFGQLFATQLNGQIYAQPLLVGHILLVATETDWVYGINPDTGATVWSRQIGKPFRDLVLQCGDLVPYLGVTSTPTTNPTGTVAYLVDQSYLSGDSGAVGWFMHAINPATGAEIPHFPVRIKGPANNNPSQPFFPTKEMQRPGLLYLGGVVYAAFGSHCDFEPYAGLIVGVSASGVQKTMWSVEGTKSGGGGGIWQGGGGLVSDGPNQILFEDGNGFGTDSHPDVPTPGSTPPANLADSVVRLVVQPNGSLKAKDFFSMYDDPTVDRHDWDLSGSPVALPSQFSTAKYPHLLVATGKQGVVYLLNRDSLGGAGEGPDHKDLVLGEYAHGEAISSAGAWPGNGGYVYVSTDAGTGGGAGKLDVYKFMPTAKGVPALRLVGISSQNTFFGVSGPLVTSDGTISGSAVVWIIDAATLQAYDPVPIGGELKLLGSWFIGDTNPFNPPGIGTNRVYAGNQAGILYGFGGKVSP